MAFLFWFSLASFLFQVIFNESEYLGFFWKQSRREVVKIAGMWMVQDFPFLYRYQNFFLKKTPFSAREGGLQEEGVGWSSEGSKSGEGLDNFAELSSSRRGIWRTRSPPPKVREASLCFCSGVLLKQNEVEVSFVVLVVVSVENSKAASLRLLEQKEMEWNWLGYFHSNTRLPVALCEPDCVCVCVLENKLRMLLISTYRDRETEVKFFPL